MPTPLSEVSQDWLDSIARALESAAGEGVDPPDDLLTAVEQEYRNRGLDEIPGAYVRHWGVDIWRRMVH